MEPAGGTSLLAQQQLLAYQAQLAAQQALFSGRGGRPGMPSGGGSSSKSARLTRLYVGSISYETTEAQIRELFSIFGPIVEMEVPMDQQTGRHKGFAFVEYGTVAEAMRAIQETNGKSVWGRNLRVNRPGEPAGAAATSYSGGSSSVVNEALAAVQQRQPGASGLYLPPSFAATGGAPAFGGAANSASKVGRIYCGNLAYDLTAEHIRQVFSAFGPIKDVTLPLDRENNNRPKGFVFVEFEQEQHGQDAIASMNGFELCGRKLRVNGATAQGSGAQGPVGVAGGSGFNAQAMAHAQLAATLLQSAGVGLSGGGGGGLETDGFLSTNAQRAALMDKLARGTAIGGESSSSAAPVIETPVLLLRNLVAPGEVDAELEAEVRDEAGQFGAIQQVVIHETSSNVLIFVLFAQAADCAKARASLDKRIFAGKLIRAIAYPKSKFDASIYVPDP